MQGVIKKDESVAIHYLKERTEGEKVHMRAVFTDIALTTGHYGYGQGQHEQETTDFSIREHKDLLEIRQKYCSQENRAFDHDLDETIVITSSAEE